METERPTGDESLAELARRQEAGTLSAAALTVACLERIERLDAGPAGLHAVRTVSPRALDDARRADEERAAGCVRSPLHGIPFLVKDSILVPGLPASAGALALAQFVPAHEATLVRRLRAAGAIFIGKTNLTEFADFVSDTMPSEFSGAGGVVRNPLGPRYDRGQGSSVGSAAAVAGGLAPFAIGSETQNSIQTPALWSSVVGFKPSAGRVSRDGAFPLVPSQDSPGPFARSVADAAQVFAVIEGPDLRDGATLGFQAAPGPVPAAAPLAGVRIGIPRAFVADKVLADGPRAEAFERALSALSRAGAVIVDPCDFPAAQALDEVRSCVFRTEFKEALDLFLQANGAPCGMAGMRDIVAWNEAHPEAIPYGQSLLLAALETQGMEGAAYRADRARDLALARAGGIAGALERGRADVLLMPMDAAAKCTGKAGAPVVALPAGADSQGRPFGVTLTSLPGDDARLLSIAMGVEAVIGQRLRARLG